MKLHAARTAVGTAVVLLLSGCGAGDSGTDSEAATAGSSDATDQVVLALDDFAALHALTLGIEPDTVYEVFDYEATSEIFDDLGLETRPYGSELDVEAVAALEPDVILGVSIPTTVAVEDQLRDIAPTTVLDYTAGWEEQLDTAAAALGREDDAERVRDRVAEHTDELAGELRDAGLTDTVVSVVGDNGGFFSPPTTTALGSALDSVGLARPPAQQQAGDAASPFVVFGAEALADHDGEHLFLLSGGPYLTEGLTGSPLWPGLRAVAAGTVAEVSGEMWLAPSAFSVVWILDDLRAVLLEQGAAAAAADAPARLAEFRDA
jgi:iron complex transport system substrate-binding protein